MGQIQSIEELVSLILRRRWLIILVTVLGMAASVIYAKLRPSTYETIAVIQIEAPAVSTDGNAGSGSAQMLQVIEQRLTTRENLAAMIDRHGLFAELPGLSMEKKVALLRESIRFQAVSRASDTGQSSGVSAILITARLGDAEKAARVANDLAQGILDQSAEGQRDRSDQNLAFFPEEAERVGSQIAGLESEVASYKNAHADALPEIAAARQDELTTLSTEIRDARQKIGVLPVSTGFTTLGRSTVGFSNMTLIEGDGFRVYVDWTTTPLTQDQFEALPDFTTLPGDVYCDVDWCGVNVG